MKVHFWGVRGSIPTPLSNRQIRNKIAAVVQRVRPHDLKDQASRERFLASLPPSLFGTVGGNTTCMEFRMSDGTEIIIDAGTGIRNLGSSIIKQHESINQFHIFFTHFHWDHLQGLPFFDPAFNPANTLNFYSPDSDFESYLRDQMHFPYFPVTMDVFQAEKNFHTIKEQPINIGNAEITWMERNHPGGCYAYKVREGDHSVIFSTDTELTESDFIRDPEHSKFFNKADVLILDSQYTLGEAIEKYNWGHSSYSLAVDFAVEWNIPHLVLFHHEPKYNDNRLFSVLNSANWYAKHVGKVRPKLTLATEDLELNLE
ncbi:MAG: MBL fold metallo-hydrolase [Spirochaetales bacterium]|nr:MBL fold metallo-hydrolase [Spirochaetales bacterium]